MKSSLLGAALIGSSLAFVPVNEAGANDEAWARASVERALVEARLKSQLQQEQKEGKKPSRISIEGGTGVLYNSNTESMQIEESKIELQFQITPRVFAHLRLDPRGAIPKVRDEANEALKNSEKLKNSVRFQLIDAFAQLGYPAEAVTDELVQQKVNEVVDAALPLDEDMSDSQVETLFREVLITVEVMKNKLYVSVGKMNPLYYQEDAVGHFATSNPCARVTYQYSEWMFTASGCNNRYGENWNPGGDIVGQLAGIMSRAGDEDLLSLDPNSYELTVQKITEKLGNVLFALGEREHNGNVNDVSQYALVQMDKKTGAFNIVLTGSVEDFEEASVEAPGEKRYRLTFLIAKQMNEKLRLWAQTYLGKNDGARGGDVKQYALILGADRKIQTWKRVTILGRLKAFISREESDILDEDNPGVAGGFIFRF